MHVQTTHCLFGTVYLRTSSELVEKATLAILASRYMPVEFTVTQ